MKTRYCGDLTITIRLNDDDTFSGAVTKLTKRWGFTDLRLSPHFVANNAIDSKLAFTNAARAAIVFGFCDEQFDNSWISDHAEFDEAGEPVVTMKKAS